MRRRKKRRLSNVGFSADFFRENIANIKLIKMNKQRRILNIILFILFGIVTLTAAALIFWQGVRPFFVSGDTHILGTILDRKDMRARLLDGVYMAEGETEKYPAAIMIDNMFEAWPQSGISEAGLVFEAPVEGGITRFMTVYSTDKVVEKIGPVRSSRPYFIDWAMEFSALYGHFGGSPAALDIIASDPKINKLNMDSSAEYFWRSKDRFAPHNAYTSSANLDKARDKKLDSQDLNFSPWKFKDEADETDRGDSKTISVTFSYSDTYNVKWLYDKAQNIYVRQVKGETVKDAEGDLIAPKNIAVIETDITVIDSVSRREIETLGTGDALIFQDGKKIEATWEKKDMWSRLRFYDKSGKEIEFVRGMTWVEVVDGADKVVAE